MSREVFKREELSADELKLILKKYTEQFKRQTTRPPDRNGHKIQMKLTFDEWLQIWLESGKLFCRGMGAGKFCMGRKEDLGDYEFGNVQILSWEENSRQAKLGRPSSIKGRVSPMKGREHAESTLALMSESAKARDAIKVQCQHCGVLTARAGYARYHGDRCKLAPAKAA